MKVILLGELKGKGGEGDVIDVATGYAVNYLFPKKIAIQATKGNLKQLELRKHNIAKRETDRLDTAEKLLAALDGQKIRIGAKVGEEGQLFGSVTPQRVADAINARFKTDIDRKRIDLHEVIKKAGEHTASVSIYRDTKANIVIEVVDEKKLATLEKAEATTEEAADTTAENVEAVEVKAEVEAEVDVEAVEAEAETVAETEVDVETEAEAEIDVEVMTEAEVDVETETEANPDVEAEAEAEAEAGTEAEAVESEN